VRYFSDFQIFLRKSLMALDSNPLRYVGIYTLDIFCDQLHDPRVKATFTGQTFSGCRVMARRAGWRIHRNTKTATCPACTKHLKDMARSFTQGRKMKKRNPVNYRQSRRNNVK
jgi:hypothetical protein